MGFYKAHTMRRRIADLQMLETAFRLLETEIYYTLTPVPTALELLAPKLPRPMQHFFQQVQFAMEQNHQPLAQAWEDGLSGLQKECFLSKEDVSILQSFGLSLGRGDREEQTKNFQVLQQRLENALEDARQSCSRQERVWQYMGVCISMAMVVLLC